MNLSSTTKRGYDTWVDNAHQHATNASGDWMRLQSGQKQGYLWMPLPPRSKGRTIASAILTGHAAGATAAQTLSFVAAAAKWQASQVTWANQPGTTGSTVAVAIPALSDGQEFTVDITTLVQPIADGTVKNFGWRVTTNSGSVQKFATFDSGDDAWTLTVEFEEAPEAPTGLAPNGTVTSASAPTFSFDFTEYGDTGTDLAQLRFQIDVGNNGTVDFDSGWVPAVVPSYSLASPLTITAGVVVAYRVQVQDTGGRQSVYSDWATYTYQPLGVGGFLTPAAGVLYDPTSEIIASLTGQTLAAFRVWVTDGNDQTSIRYDSGKQPATDPHQAALELPLKNSHGSRIFTDDDDYQIHVRLFDTLDREATPGAPARVDLWTTVHFDDDLALTPVASVQARQVDATPFVRLTWTDAAAADAYLVSRDGVQIARLDPVDTIAGVSSYTWDDMAAAPAVRHVYDIRRLTVGVGRSATRQTSVRMDPEGIWLLRDNGDYVVLDDTNVDQLVTNERRLRYSPINLQNPVDILTQYEGITGPITASIEDDVDQTVAHARQVLDAIKRAPTKPVQLIYATVSKPVLVSNLTVLPSPDYRADMDRHVVSFTVDQVGDFDYRIS